MMKKFLIGLWGIMQGIIGTAWSGLGLAFIQHPNSGPGTKDWEEDKMFIPIGYIMVVIWLVITGFSYYKLRKNKSDIIIFTTTWLIGTAIYIIFIL